MATNSPNSGAPLSVTLVGDSATGATSVNVQGADASGSAVTGNPVLVGMTDGTNARALNAQSNSGDAASGAIFPPVGINAFNSTGWDRVRTVGIGNGVASTGILAAGEYGQYNTIGNQPALTTGQYGAAQLDSAGNQKVVTGAPANANILSGYLQHTTTTSAATVITIGAGKTFTGTVTVSVAASKAAAATGNGLVSALIATAGTNVTPAAGTIFAVSTRVGANAATGTVGTQGSNFGSIPIVVNAPAGNSVTITLASTLTSITEGAVD